MSDYESMDSEEEPLKMPAKKIPKVRDTSRKTTEEKFDKKITTKIMITNALKELKTRKGVSVQAIKKYLNEKYKVDTEKKNFIIKKSLKTGVEEGTFAQLKGIGASGSFKLVENKEPKPKKKEKVTEKTEKGAKPSVKKSATDSKKAPQNKDQPKMKKLLTDETEVKAGKKVNKTEKLLMEKKPKSKMAEKVAKLKADAAKEINSPSKKKKALMKRKSVGSIIKPPKMKPKSK